LAERFIWAGAVLFPATSAAPVGTADGPGFYYEQLSSHES